MEQFFDLLNAVVGCSIGMPYSVAYCWEKPNFLAQFANWGTVMSLVSVIAGGFIAVFVIRMLFSLLFPNEYAIDEIIRQQREE